MADTITKIADLVDPEVMADMISAKIPNKIRVAPFAKVDTTLKGVPGDTVTVPSYGYIGDAEDVAEGAEVTIEKMSTSTKQTKVKKAMKGVGLTDEAILSGYIEYRGICIDPDAAPAPAAPSPAEAFSSLNAEDIKAALLALLKNK